MLGDQSKNNKRKTPKTIVCKIVKVSIIVCIAVHILFKIEAPFHWLVAEWTAGEILTFIASVFIFIGTYLLGVRTSETANKYQEIANKLSEDNNRLQKILAQNSLPIFAVNDAKVTQTMDCDRIEPSILNKTQSFTIAGVHSSEKSYIKVYVNVDANKEKCLTKELILRLGNISEVPIRHLAIEKIVINGFTGHFEKVECNNAINPKTGRSLAIRPMQSLQINFSVYYDNIVYEKVWEDNCGGLTLTMFIENTSFSGEKFKQSICVSVPNNELWEARYGDSLSMET